MTDQKWWLDATELWQRKNSESKLELSSAEIDEMKRNFERCVNNSESPCLLLKSKDSKWADKGWMDRVGALFPNMQLYRVPSRLYGPSKDWEDNDDYFYIGVRCENASWFDRAKYWFNMY